MIYKFTQDFGSIVRLSALHLVPEKDKICIFNDTYIQNVLYSDFCCIVRHRSALRLVPEDLFIFAVVYV